MTLTGPGGVGKTRLALQAAAELFDTFRDGVWFVDLGPLLDAALVPAAIAAVLAVPEEGIQPLGEVLKDYLRSKTLLLLLDNFEHVVEAAPFVASLLAVAPNLKVLTTSRAPLRLRGERELGVPPLAVPDPAEIAANRENLEQLTQYEAVRLFISRAQDAKADFAVTNETAPAVAEICARLDGLPLAIELAAARIKLLPPRALLARLDSRLALLTSGPRDAPARQRTLRDAIAWSHDLLSPDEQTLLRRIAVFVRGATFEAAEAVANPDGALDLFNGLASLVDESLVRQQTGPDGESRFSLLQTIREFALEQLTSQGEEATMRQAHASYFSAMVDEARPRLAGEEQAGWLDRFDGEQDNLRAALGWWLVGQHSANRGLQLAATLWWFWWVRGNLSERLDWLERALTAAPNAEPQIRAHALSGAGTLLEARGDYRDARVRHEAALALYKQAGDMAGVAKELESLGAIAQNQGEFSQAEALFTEALALSSTISDRQGEAHSLLNLGELATRRDDIAHATNLFRDGLTLLQGLGDARGITVAQGNLSRLAFLDGSLKRAATLGEEALASSRQLGDKQSTAVLLSNLGEIAQRQGDLDRAMTLYAEALPLFQELGDRRNIAATLGTIGEVELARGNVTGGRVLLADSLTMFNEVGDKEEIARRLEVLAGFAVDQEQAEVAASLLGGAAALRDQIGAPLATVYRADYERWVATTRKALGELAFAATWEAGKALPIDQAIAEAVALARGEPASAQASDSPAVIAPAPSSTITRADGKS